MNSSVVLILMIFAHIVDDFYLQGVLAKMKQKEWWKNNAPDALCKFDYLVALVIHAISWSIMITLPILFASAWDTYWTTYLMLGINVVIHAIVDDLKANRHKINLACDQFVHFMQIHLTWLVWLIVR